MARLPRLTAAGFPHHVIQRGNNRQRVFVDDADHVRLLDLLVEYAARFKVAVHGYVLMPNHFHLLATPADPSGLPQMMKLVGQRYAQHHNKRHRRTGTLWEGRYRSTLVDTEVYLLACMAYIDLNPVRAGLAGRPGEYRWSSYGHYAGLGADRVVTPHSLYWGLGNTPFAREAAYIDLVAQGGRSVPDRTVTEATLKGWALGGPDFVERIRSHSARRPTRSRAGRPAGTKRRRDDD